MLGMNRFDGSNTRGDKFMFFFGSNNLRVYNTFYTHDNYITYVSKGLEKTPSMHDIFSIAKTSKGQRKVLQSNLIVYRIVMKNKSSE